MKISTSLKRGLRPTLSLCGAARTIRTRPEGGDGDEHESTDTLTDALSPILQARGLDLIDVELNGAQLTVFVDREGGIDLDELGDATRDVSAALDDIDPIPGRYTLSVSSPGLERRLRTPAHYARAVGEKVTVRIDAGTADVRRVTGHARRSADESGCTADRSRGARRRDADRLRPDRAGAHRF